MKIYSFILFFSFFSYTTKAQDQIQPAKEYNSFGFNLEFSWFNAIDISYNHLLSNNVQFKFTTGPNGSVGGLNYYFSQPIHNKMNYYTGLSAGLVYFNNTPMVQFPVGFSYLNKKNIEFKIEGSMIYHQEDTPIYGDNNIIISYTDPLIEKFTPNIMFGIGYRFGKDFKSIQEIEPTELKRILSLNIGGYDVFGGIVYERLITPFFSAEVGLGFAGASLGSRFYFPSIRKNQVNFHLGQSTSWGINPSDGYTGTKTYIPFGINYFSNKNLMYSVDVGPQFWFDELDPTVISFSVRVGKVF